MGKQSGWYETGRRYGGVSFRCEVRPFVLTLTNQHVDHPGHWVGSCSGLGADFDTLRLKTPGKTEFAQDAQEELMNAVIEVLNRAAMTLHGMDTVKVGE